MINYKNAVFTELNDRIRKYKQADQNRKRKGKFTNLHVHLDQAIKKLRSRDDLVIRASDKNMGLALIKRDCYINDCLKHLQNTKAYIEVEATTVSSTILFNGLIVIIEKYKDVCSEKDKNYILQELDNQNLTLCKFYISPKVHKDIYDTRPICSNLNYALYYVSKYIHKMLLPIMTYYTNHTNTDSPILNNNMQLLEQLDNISLVKKPILLSADVSSLYPNIPIDDALDYIREILYNKKHNTLLVIKMK